MGKEQIIRIEGVSIEIADTGQIEIDYIPSQDQHLIKGQTYRFVFSIDGIKFKINVVEP
jgi:hypothetical protein